MKAIVPLRFWGLARRLCARFRDEGGPRKAFGKRVALIRISGRTNTVQTGEQ